MVSISLDLYELRNRIKSEIAKRIEEVTVNDSVDFGWLVYALHLDNDNMFATKLKELERWAYSEAAGTRDKDLAPLALYVYFATTDIKKECPNEILEKIKFIVGNNLSRPILDRYNVLNDPSQIYCLSLIAEVFTENYREKLIEVIFRRMKGTPSRKLLYAAAMLNFGVEKDRVESSLKVFDKNSLKRPEDIIATLWFLEKYRDLIGLEDVLAEVWEQFDRMYYQIGDESGRPVLLLNRDLVLLYEALLSELKKPNPFMLLNLYPFSPEIRKIISEYIIERKDYSTCIFESVIRLIKLIEEKSGKYYSSEVNLIRDTTNPRRYQRFEDRDPGELTILFNDFLDTTQGRSEQEGLSLILEGIYKAFRNPRGHELKDHPLLRIDPYEALAQLITIDYMWKRIEKAKIQKSENVEEPNSRS